MRIKTWLVDTLIRATKTFAQTLVAMFGGNSLNILHVDWKADLAVALGAFITSVLQNIQTFPIPTDPISEFKKSVEQTPIPVPPLVLRDPIVPTVPAVPFTVGDFPALTVADKGTFVTTITTNTAEPTFVTKPEF